MNEPLIIYGLIGALMAVMFMIGRCWQELKELE